MQFDSSKILARSTLDMGQGGRLTLPSSNYIIAKVKWLWKAVKISISLAFSKLVLDVKVKFLLISWHLSNQYFLQQKKTNLYPKYTFILIAPSRIKHQHMIIDLFTLNFSHQRFIRSKEEINFLRFTDGSFHKNSKIQVIKGLSSNKMNQY